MQNKSSVTEPRQLDEAELDLVSGGQGFSLALVGDQLTLKVGNTTSFVRTLTTTQAAALEAAASDLEAGNFGKLFNDIGAFFAH